MLRICVQNLKFEIRFCLVVDVDELDRAIIAQFRGVSQHALTAALHTVIIDFELSYSINNFYINFHCCCRQLNNMH